MAVTVFYGVEEIKKQVGDNGMLAYLFVRIYASVDTGTQRLGWVACLWHFEINYLCSPEKKVIVI